MKTKNKITTYVGPFTITVNRFSAHVGFDGFAEIGGELSALMPTKMTDAEWSAFREWLAKCPFDPESYNRN